MINVGRKGRLELDVVVMAEHPGLQSTLRLGRGYFYHRDFGCLVTDYSSCVAAQNMVASVSHNREQLAIMVSKSVSSTVVTVYLHKTDRCAGLVETADF